MGKNIKKKMHNSCKYKLKSSSLYYNFIPKNIYIIHDGGYMEIISCRARDQLFNSE
jgi:hypothetical protein